MAKAKSKTPAKAKIPYLEIGLLLIGIIVVGFIIFHPKIDLSGGKVNFWKIDPHQYAIDYKINDTLFVIRANPDIIREIPVSGNISFINSERVSYFYILINPNDSALTAVAANEIQKICTNGNTFGASSTFAGALNKPCFYAYTEKYINQTVPVLSLENATENVPIIYLKQGSITRITAEGNKLITLEAANQTNFDALCDRVVFELLGLK